MNILTVLILFVDNTFRKIDFEIKRGEMSAKAGI